MKPQQVILNLRWSGRVLAWSALMVMITLLLALLLQALAAGALVAPGQPGRADACLQPARHWQTATTCGKVF